VTRFCDFNLRILKTNALLSVSVGNKVQKRKRATKTLTAIRQRELPLHLTKHGRGCKAQIRRIKEMATAAVGRLKRKLPDRLATVRADRSQRQFARDLGVFQQNVNRYESGTTPHTDFLITLALKENISIDWLLLGKGKMRKGR
jgi:hypothetical protein